MIELQKNFLMEIAFQFIEYIHCVDDFTFNKFEKNVKVKVFVILAIRQPSHKIFGFCAAVLAP